MFEFFVYNVWACLKGMTLYNTLKEKSSNKKYYNNDYNYYGEGGSKHWDLH